MSSQPVEKIPRIAKDHSTRFAKVQSKRHFLGSSEMATRIFEFDWSQTPVGPIDFWPPSLKTATTLMVNSRHPIVLWWGRSTFIQLYNDAYIPILGPAKHPAFLGRSGQECWSEIWSTMWPMWESVFATGEATWSEDFLYVLNRNLPREEGFFNFSYSPLWDEGEIAGIFCACYETTERVIGERRLRTLRDLGRTVSSAKNPDEACELAANTLAANPADIPFALIYLLDGDGECARLVASTGLGAESKAAPARIELSELVSCSTWPMGRVFKTGSAELISDLTTRFGCLPARPWPEPSELALILPIAASAQTNPTGFLVAGLSPRRIVDADYRSFLDLVAGQLATAVANAGAYEQERKRAEALAEIDRAKTVFFSNVSHEFRTPLSLILGPLEEALGQAQLPSETREQVEVAQRNSLRLLKLVNTLLDFSRIEAGRIEANYEPVELASFTAELASLFRSAIEKAGLRLLVDCPSLPDQVFVDREMWEKIVFNLLSNAFKFTFTGTIAVRLRAVGRLVELTVSDTGTGIPEGELSHIFKRFHRIRSAKGRTHEGTGIGLALVQELVRLHSGDIAVESAYGEGTTFRIHLPFGKAHLPPEQLRSAREHASTAICAEAFVDEALRWSGAEQTAQPFQPLLTTDSEFSSRGTSTHVFSGKPTKKILVIDDNADMRDYLCRLLNGRYELRVAANGNEALSLIKKDLPDLILTDIMMPELDGFGLIQELRKDSATRFIPIVVLSARAGEEARIDGLEAGADDYVVKPFTARELLARVAMRLNLHETQQALRESEKQLRQGNAQLAEHLIELQAANAEIQSSRRAALNLMEDLSDEIKERRHAEEILRRSSSQYETLVNQTPLGVYLVDDDFRIRQVNPIALPVFGDIPDLIGRDLDQVMHILWPKEYADEIIGIFRNTLETGESYETQERIEKRLDRGITEYYAWRVDRIPLPEGGFGIVCYFSDISVQVQARLAIAESEERSRKLEKLAAAGQLAASLAHEINNPLSSVTNALYILDRYPNLDEFTRNFVGMASSELARVSRIVKQSLSYYRVGMQPKPFNLATIVQESLQIFAHKCEQAGIHLIPKLQNGPSVLGFADEIRQIVDILIINAMEAMPSGGKLTVSVHNSCDWRHPQKGVRLTIADSGCGIPKDNCTKIFEPFFTTKAEKGTGLGLWVLRSIVAKHDGAVRVRSSDIVGKSGTTISVFFASQAKAFNEAQGKFDSAAQVTRRTN